MFKFISTQSAKREIRALPLRLPALPGALSAPRGEPGGLRAPGEDRPPGIPSGGPRPPRGRKKAALLLLLRSPLLVVVLIVVLIMRPHDGVRLVRRAAV